MKSKRHALILELIEKEFVATQEDLLLKLREHGFDVTQATVSRDIKELRLVKKMDASGQYCYAVNKVEANDFSMKFLAIVTESVIDVDYAGNMAVVKCYPGMAQAACAAIDAMNFEGIIGTLAGDDTIFALCRTEENSVKLKVEIEKMIMGG